MLRILEEFCVESRLIIYQSKSEAIRIKWRRSNGPCSLYRKNYLVINTQMNSKTNTRIQTIIQNKFIWEKEDLSVLWKTCNIKTFNISGLFNAQKKYFMKIRMYLFLREDERIYHKRDLKKIRGFFFIKETELWWTKMA